MDVETLNRAYRAVNAELARQNRALADRERELENSNRHFNAALGNMAQGLCMFDAELRVVACNDHYRDLFKMPAHIARPGATLKEMIEYNVAAGMHPGETIDDVLSVRLDIFSRGNAATLRTIVEGKRVIEVSYRPIERGGWVVTYDDVTDREQVKESLAEQNKRFDAALNNMPHGLCMFRQDKTLIVCNQRYGEMYRLPAELTLEGTSLEAIISYRAATNQGPCDTQLYWDEHVRRASEGKLSSYKLLLTDGRTIQVDHQPLIGGGWVATHQDVTDAIRAAEQIHHMARHDSLTGLANRSRFRDELEESLKRAAQGDQSSVLCLDLDHFKRVNDTLGHFVGDQLLKQVAERIKQCARETDLVARLGGDEFAIIQNGGTQPNAARSLAARVIEAVSCPYTLGNNSLITGVSIGIALAQTDGTTAEELLKNADLALYRSKEDGRGVYSFFEAEMDAKMQERRLLELDLRQALAKNELRLVYQPIVDIDKRAAVGFEALLRWNRAGREAVPPSDFIPLAEEIGLISQIGRWVLREACIEAVRWPAALNLAVNLSPVQFKNPTLVLDVASALGASGLAPHRLELEITETVMLNDTEMTIRTLRNLKELGVRIAMDDFGTGYSSLSYLRKFPFDKLKIDQSFIQSLGHEHESAAIVKAIIGLGSSLAMRITAEGVETLDQLNRLVGEGCGEAQGYYFSRPVEAAEVLSVCQDIARSMGAKSIFRQSA